MSNLTEDIETLAWDMSLTREMVRERWGDKELEALRPVLRAVTTRLIHARIHYKDYQNLVSTHLAHPLEAGRPWWELMWVSEEKDVGANNYFFVAAEGYVYACVQALHAIADNLSHVIYYSLGWNLDKRLPLYKVSLATVRVRLTQEVASAPDLAPLHLHLETLGREPNFEALSDATNHIKHHGGLPLRVSWGDSQEALYEMQLSAFSRKQHVRPPQEIAAFLKATYDTMNRAVVTTGRALNEWLQLTVT